MTTVLATRPAIKPNEMTAAQAARAIAGGELTCEALTEACLARIADRDADVKAWAEQGPQEGDDAWVAEAHSLAVELAGAPLPSIALLNGAAVGAGLDLALACEDVNGASQVNLYLRRFLAPVFTSGSALAPPTTIGPLAPSERPASRTSTFCTCGG